MSSIPMTIQNPLLNTSFQPEEVEELAAAYQQILRDLDLERSSSLAQTIAKEIFELAEQGVRTRKQLTEMVMEEFWSH